MKDTAQSKHGRGAARHGRGMAWARHDMCDLALMLEVCIRKQNVHNGQNQTAIDIEHGKQNIVKNFIVCENVNSRTCGF